MKASSYPSSCCSLDHRLEAAMAAVYLSEELMSLGQMVLIHETLQIHLLTALNNKNDCQ
jgi:hypothetical protein